jgi:hypothetical protein
MAFSANQKFRKKYNRIFQDNPEAANLYLLLCELADENGQVVTNEEEIALLMTARFNDPKEYAL